jgi:hypothetical protein
MNFLAHTAVALASSDEPPFLLGAGLPDLASMARVRIDRSRLRGGVQEGVRCHLRSDEVFHAHPEFRRGTAQMRSMLADGGLRPGAVRAVAHVGWELMLDGTLVRTPAEAAFRRGLAVGANVTQVVAPADRERWIEFLGWWEQAPMSSRRLRYDDPEWVTERLHRILAARPRLAFAEEDGPTVADVLQASAGQIARVADGVIDDVVQAVGQVAPTRPTSSA